MPIIDNFENKVSLVEMHALWIELSFFIFFSANESCILPNVIPFQGKWLIPTQGVYIMTF